MSAPEQPTPEALRIAIGSRGLPADLSWDQLSPALLPTTCAAVLCHAAEIDGLAAQRAAEAVERALSPEATRYLLNLVESDLNHLRVDLADVLDDGNAIADISNDMRLAIGVKRTLEEGITAATPPPGDADFIERVIAICGDDVGQLQENLRSALTNVSYWRGRCERRSKERDEARATASSRAAVEGAPPGDAGERARAIVDSNEWDRHTPDEPYDWEKLIAIIAAALQSGRTAARTEGAEVTREAAAKLCEEMGAFGCAWAIRRLPLPAPKEDER